MPVSKFANEAFGSVILEKCFKSQGFSCVHCDKIA